MRLKKVFYLNKYLFITDNEQYEDSIIENIFWLF